MIVCEDCFKVIDRKNPRKTEWGLCRKHFEKHLKLAAAILGKSEQEIRQLDIPLMRMPREE